MSIAPELVFEKIVLRQIRESDISIREDYGIDIEYAKMTGSSFEKIGNFNTRDANKWYERIKKHPCKWIIEYDKKFIGVASLRPYTEDNKAKYAIELYDKECYGKGIGTRVTNMVLEYAFNVKEYHKVFLRVLDYNHRAIAVYKKCGFLQEGVDREGALINGTYHSDVYMGILKTEYIE